MIENLIRANHNRELIESAINTLKQFTEEGFSLMLFDKEKQEYLRVGKEISYILLYNSDAGYSYNE